ncbi:phage head closure protein [Paenibacillus eucommiae]|uniref:SPP1 family predicted phage head-tail adaptor n=1 Tax=Paenibacillus eucommiae TaxID=1355755 RepID=A0ABS4IZP8_9BACL|nr:phage head closure protein [Paenibacillus eucommiae]MBP1992545.1 SPP1 family predicted phage head-tail adaptor [Paenibacillus eucommiae]
MRLDSVIYLISKTTEENEIGDPIFTTVKREIFAEKNSVRQSEFYQAAAHGLKPELTFIVWKQEYLDEERLEFEKRIYDIIRTFEKDSEFIELVCQGISGHLIRGDARLDGNASLDSDFLLSGSETEA